MPQHRVTGWGIGYRLRFRGNKVRLAEEGGVPGLCGDWLVVQAQLVAGTVSPAMAGGGVRSGFSAL